MRKHILVPWREWTITLVAALCLGGAGRAVAGTILCEHNQFQGDTENTQHTCKYRRDVTIFFGTFTVIGPAVPDSDIVELSDTITGTLAGQIYNDSAQDPRVRVGVGAFIDPLIDQHDWLVAAPQNLPAQQNLLDQYAALAGSLAATYGPGSLQIGAAALNLGPREYNIANWTTQEAGSGSVDVVDDVFHTHGTVVTTQHSGYADVTAFEQNATWTLKTTAVPEPGTSALLAAGLFGLVLLRRAVRARATPDCRSIRCPDRSGYAATAHLAPRRRPARGR